MSLEQHFPFLYGTKHGYVRRLDMKAFEKNLKRLDFLDRYFNVTFEGMENIPAEGNGLLVGNHGPMGLDAPFIVKHVYQDTGRVVRPLADRAVFRSPGMRVGAAKMGVVEGDRDQAIEMLKEGNLMSVYPGGLRETVKAPDEKYQVRQFWFKATGFVKVCLASGAPIIPVACVGIDEIFTQLRTAEQMKDTFVMKRWQKQMGSDKYTSPLFVGWGPLPKRVKFTYLIGEPIKMEHGPEAIDDPAIVEEYKEKTIVALENLLDKGLAERHIPKRHRTSPAKVVGKIGKNVSNEINKGIRKAKDAM